MDSNLKFNGFISYLQIPDKQLAIAIREGLMRLGAKKHLLKFRALEIFRDEANVSGTGTLAERIQEGIDDSEYLILLARPEIKKSSLPELKNWVYEEVDYWLQSKHRGDLEKNQPIDDLKIIICVVDGAIQWQGNDFNWEMTTCLNEILKNKFNGEPKWVNFRGITRKLENKPEKERGKILSLKDPEFLQKIAEISAEIQNKTVDELIAEDRIRQKIWGGILGITSVILVILTILSLFFGYRSNINEKKAIELLVKNQNELGINAKVLSRTDQTLYNALSTAVDASAKIQDNPNNFLGVQEGLTASLSRYLTNLSIEGKGTGVAFDFYESENKIVSAASDGLISIWSIDSNKQEDVMGELAPVGVGSFRRFTKGDITRDNKYFIGQFAEPTIQIWDLRKKEKHFEISLPLFIGSLDKYSSLSASRIYFAVSPDCRYLVSSLPESVQVVTGKGMQSGKAYTGATAMGIWDLNNKELQYALKIPNDIITSIKWSSSGKYIAAGTLYGKVLIWSTEDRTLKKEIIANYRLTNSINQLEFGVNDDDLYIACEDATLKIYDLTDFLNPRLKFNYKVFNTLPILQRKNEEDDDEDSDPHSFTFKLSPSQNRLLILYDGRCYLWRLTDTARSFLLDKTDEIVRIKDADFSRDGLLIATISSHIIRVWDADRGLFLKQFDAPSHDLEHVRFFPLEDQYKIVTSEFSKLTFWTLSSKDFINTLWGDPKFIYKSEHWPSNVSIGWNKNERSVDVIRGVVSPNKKILLIASANGVVQAYDPTGNILYSLNEYSIDGRYAPFEFSKSGKYFLLKNLDDTLLVFDAANGKRISFYKPTERISYAAVSPDGKKLAIAVENSDMATNTDGSTTFADPRIGNSPKKPKERYTIKLVDLNNNNKIITELTGHEGRIRDIDFSSDGNSLVSCSEDSTARIWSLIGNKKEIVCRGHKGIIWHVSFSGNCGLVSTACADSTAVIWDAFTGKKKITLELRNSVTTARFSEDCSKIITSSSSQVQIWDINTGEEENRFIVHDEKFVINSDFLSDNYLCSVGQDGTFRIYPISMISWRQKATELLNNSRNK